MVTTHQNLKLALSNVTSLTLSEWNILLFISEGMNSKTIAIRVNLMPKSIDNYKNRIGKKLGLTGYGKLFEFAVKYRHQLKKRFKSLAIVFDESQSIPPRLKRRPNRKILTAAAEQ